MGLLTTDVPISSSYHPTTASGVAAFGLALIGNLCILSVGNTAEPLLLQAVCTRSPDPGSWNAK